MQITDLKGMVITVTDLDAGIAMVEQFLSYTHTNDDEWLTRFEQQRLQYWTDIHNKLLQLKTQSNDGQ